MRRALLAIAASAVTLSFGHLTPGSLKFSRSGPYHPGDTVTVSFAVDVPHSGVNIDFSKDGKAWTTLKSNMSAPSKMTYSYKWTVGSDTTTHGKIRICQMSGSSCTNADTVDDPSGRIKGSRYVLISPLLTIASTTGLSPRADEDAPSLRAIAPGSLDLAFSLPSEGRITLAAFDARGREAAVLLDARYAAGSHRLSLFSEALRAHPDWILRLDVAGRIRSARP